MITDLHSGKLHQRQWGPKASNLALIASAGISVPPGLCLWPQVVGAAARDLAVGAWLSECRATSLIIRSSTATEDRHDVSGAGRSLSLPAVVPDVVSVNAAIESVSIAAAENNLELKSVVVQEEVLPSVSGVAFYTRRTGELIVEADEARFAVTSGSRVRTHAQINQDGTVTITRGFLAASEARALYALAVSCADLLDYDPDIEWGYVGGAMVLFQARPITRAAHG
jgi:hypothetical protein